MKQIPILLCFIFLAITLKAQNDTLVIPRLIVYNNKTIERIDTFKVHLEYVKYNYQIFFLKLQPKNQKELTLEYYRIDDKKYHYRKFLHKNVVEEGIFEAKSKPSSVDTIITFDPETFYEIYRIYENYEPIKVNQWVETDASGRKIMGNYINGNKSGTWRYLEVEKPIITWNYSNGQLIDSNITAYNFKGNTPCKCCSNRIPLEVDEFLSFFPSQSIKAKNYKKAILQSNILKTNYPAKTSQMLAIFSFDKEGFVSSKTSFPSHGERPSIEYFLRDDKNRMLAYKSGNFDSSKHDSVNYANAILDSKYIYPEKGITIKEKVVVPNGFEGKFLDSIGHQRIERFDDKNRLVEVSYVNKRLVGNKIEKSISSTKYIFDETNFTSTTQHYQDKKLSIGNIIKYTKDWQISSIETLDFDKEVIYGTYKHYNNSNQIISYKSLASFYYEDQTFCPDAQRYELIYTYNSEGLLNSILYLYSDTEIIINITYQ